MKKTIRMKKMLSLLLCTVLIAAMALFAQGCSAQEDPAPAAQTYTAPENGSVLGEGAKKFDFAIVDKEGNETQYEIHTDAETVGEALLALGLIEGEEGPYGLYIKSVLGIRADYDLDGVYWAFYENGAYAMTGAELTAITDGAQYLFKVEK